MVWLGSLGWDVKLLFPQGAKRCQQFIRLLRGKPASPFYKDKQQFLHGCLGLELLIW